MFTSHQKSTGTQYTVVVALMIFTCGFGPVMLMSGAFDFRSVLQTIALSVSGLAVAWFSWTRHSRRTIPSIAAPRTRVPMVHSQS